jgi:hypothetical protein
MRAEFAGNGKNSGDPEQKKCEEHPAKDHEVHAEKAERGSIHISEATGVWFVEIAVRELAVEHAFGGLRENAFIVRDPT